MNEDLDKKIEFMLVGIMADGFNRSMNALEDAGAISRKKMQKHYKGIGSKYYDIVTEQLEYTAYYAKQAIIELIEEEKKKDTPNQCINN